MAKKKKYWYSHVNGSMCKEPKCNDYPCVMQIKTTAHKRWCVVKSGSAINNTCYGAWLLTCSPSGKDGGLDKLDKSQIVMAR